MVTCEVCGSEDFEKHAGFMYCAVCQTQSQDYHEQEYEYRDHEMNVTRRQKSPATSMKSVKQNVYDDGLWTTWEAFNYILFGMLKEMKKCGVNKEFDEMVFKVWAAYLRECRAAFTSKFEEKIPKLRLRFKERDARVLYNTDVASSVSRKRKLRSRSCVSKISNTSDSTQSRRSLVSQRKKIIASDYQDYLSLSMQSNSNLADETLESLGRSSELETTEESSDDSESLVKSFKHMFSKKDFQLYKDSYNSKRLKVQARVKAVKDITYPGKNRLLSIIHLALLLTGSQIQLSDLLRFIRESHLSFAKVTHFFPKEVKFPRKDFSYIEVISDASMPTHLRQRSITGQLARLLKVEKIPTPNTGMLIDRYCQDLNLPKQMAELAKKMLEGLVAPATAPRARAALPSYEAWAMASVILAMKLLLGLNDKTEIFLSHLALELNRAGRSGRSHFVFKDWQKFIECRKRVLATFHYPTQEQLNGSSLHSSKMFLDVLMKESKDEYRKERFIPYSRYYIEEKFLNGVKQILNSMSKTQSIASFEFQPSLTPQMSNMETIMACAPFEFTERPKSGATNYRSQEFLFESFEGTVGQGMAFSAFQNLPEGFSCDVREGDVHVNPSTSFPEDTLKEDFRDCDLQFTVDSKSYLHLVEKNSEFFTRFGISQDLSADESFEMSNTDADFLLNCSSRYWTLHYSDTTVGHLCNFKDEILEKTPENFQWFLAECARMLEMNVRDIYNELMHLEKKLSREMQP